KSNESRRNEINLDDGHWRFTPPQHMRDERVRCHGALEVSYDMEFGRRAPRGEGSAMEGIAERGTSSSIAAATTSGAAWCGMCPMSLSRRSFADGNIAARARALICGETIVSQSPVIMTVGVRRSP